MAKRSRRQDSNGNDESLPQLNPQHLWEIIQPDLIWLAGAVVTALAAAYVNVMIPSLLGEVSARDPPPFHVPCHHNLVRLQ